MNFNGQLLSGDEVIANIENNTIVPIVKNKFHEVLGVKRLIPRLSTYSLFSYS